MQWTLVRLSWKLPSSWKCPIMVEALSPHPGSHQTDTAPHTHAAVSSTRSQLGEAPGRSGHPTLSTGSEPSETHSWHQRHRQRAAGRKAISFLLQDQLRRYLKPSLMPCDTSSCATKDKARTHLSSLVSTPQVWVLETPKIKTWGNFGTWGHVSTCL